MMYFYGLLTILNAIASFANAALGNYAFASLGALITVLMLSRFLDTVGGNID